MIGSVCNYSIIVPETPDESGVTWRAKAEPSRIRLPGVFGDVARVEITPVSPRPGVLYSRIQLTRDDSRDSWGLMFLVDRTMTSMLRRGDAFHLRRTGCGGVALSAVRDGELLAAAGALGSVPLGRGIQVQVPFELVQEASAVFRRVDPEYWWHEAPVEVVIEGAHCLSHRGTWRMGDYEVFVVHGRINGRPGTDECLAISRVSLHLEVAANSTALMLERPPSQGGPNTRPEPI